MLNHNSTYVSICSVSAYGSICVGWYSSNPHQQLCVRLFIRPFIRHRLSQEWLTQLGVRLFARLPVRTSLASMDAAGKPSLLEVFALAAARRPRRLLPADGPGTSSDCEEERPDAMRGQKRKTPVSGSRITTRFCDRQQWQKDLHGLRAKVEAATGRLRL